MAIFQSESDQILRFVIFCVVDTAVESKNERLCLNQTIAVDSRDNMAENEAKLDSIIQKKYTW